MMVYHLVLAKSSKKEKKHKFVVDQYLEQYFLYCYICMSAA